MIKKFFKNLLLIPVRNPIKWRIFKAISIGIPSALITYLAYQFSIIEPIQHIKSKNFFETHKILIPILIGAPIFLSILFDLYESFANYLKEREIDYSPSLHLTTILSSINIIVGRKLDRFGKMAKEIRKKPLPSKEVFNQITQPMNQIDEIICQLWSAMVKLTEIKDLKIVLVAVTNGVPTDYVKYVPFTDRPHDGILKSNESFFHYIARTKSYKFIPDLEKEYNENKALNTLSKRKKAKSKPILFHFYDGCSLNGSIAGFPIRNQHLDEMAYIITFKSDRPNAINKTFQKKYTKLWQEFTDRILLEHNLQEIKIHAK